MPLKPSPRPSPVPTGEGETTSAVTGIRKITSLAELETLCTRIVKVPVEIYREVVQIEMRLLHPEETEKITAILQEALPPLKYEAVEGQPVPPAEPAGTAQRTVPTGKPYHDFSDPEYLKKLHHQRQLARAMALYLAVPMFRERVDGSTGYQPVSSGDPPPRGEIGVRPDDPVSGKLPETPARLAGLPELDCEAILVAVQGFKLTERVLKELYSVALSEDAELEAALNFT